MGDGPCRDREADTAGRYSRRSRDNPDVLVVIASRTYGEQRYKAIGAAGGVILFIAYTMRGNNICRIIRRQEGGPA